MSTIEKALNRLRHSGKPDQSGRAIPAAADPRQPLPSMDAPRQTASPLPSVDMGQLRRHDILPPADMRQALRDQYRRIKRPLVANALGRGVTAVPRGNTIMVTSAVAGEGKTFTSLHLAMSIAQDPDLSVTLVDGDISRSRISHLLGLMDEPGLIDLLSDERLTVDQVRRPTSFESLSLIPAGNHHGLGEELLSSERMNQVLERLADPDRHHITLFDSAPILTSPEATALASGMGQIVMVVKAASTMQHQVLAALDMLDQSKAINLVLNQALGGSGTDEYGGSYGETYGTG